MKQVQIRAEKIKSPLGGDVFLFTFLELVLFTAILWFF